MDAIRKILIEDIARINIKEKRDGRLKVNSDFVYKHPYLGRVFNVVNDITIHNAHAR